MKNSCFLLIFIFIFCCGSYKNNKKKNFINGSTNNIDITIDIDSLHIVTPSIQLYTNKNGNYKYRKEITDFVIQILKENINTAQYFELDLMSKDYKTINSFLESRLHEKSKNPNFEISVPDELLITEKKYSLLLSLIGVYGSVQNGQFNLTIIDNFGKTILTTHGYELKGSPLNKALLKDQIEKSLKQFLK